MWAVLVWSQVSGFRCAPGAVTRAGLSWEKLPLASPSPPRLGASIPVQELGNGLFPPAFSQPCYLCLLPPRPAPASCHLQGRPHLRSCEFPVRPQQLKWGGGGASAKITLEEPTLHCAEHVYFINRFYT